MISLTRLSFQYRWSDQYQRFPGTKKGFMKAAFYWFLDFMTVFTVKQYELLEAVFSSIMRGYQSKADKFELGQLATVSFPCS